MALHLEVFSLAKEYRILLDYSYGKLQPCLSTACTVGLIDVYFFFLSVLPCQQRFLSHANDFVKAKSHAKEKPLLVFCPFQFLNKLSTDTSVNCVKYLRCGTVELE